MHEFDPNRRGLCKVHVSGRMCHLPVDAPVHTRFEDKQKEIDHRLLAPVCPKCGCSNVRIEWMNGQVVWIKCLGTDSGEFCDSNAACVSEYVKFFEGE